MATSKKKQKNRKKPFLILAVALSFLILSVVTLVLIGYQRQENLVFPDKLAEGFKRVKDLRIGDWVYVKKGEGMIKEKITGIEKYFGDQVTYNLKTEGLPTFFANDFAVHNKAGPPDTERPVCRVIVNPTVTNVSIKNPSFESPLWCGTYKDEDGEKWPCMNCPFDWYNRSDGGGHNDQLWCDYGLAVTKSGYHPDGAQHVVTGYPNYGGFQRLSGLSAFGSPGGVLYRGSASGQGCPAFIGLRDDGRYGNIASVANTNTCGWSRGSLLGWDFDTFHLICRNCEEGDEAAFDLVSLEKLVGSTNVSSQNVKIYVAFDDNRNVEFLSHWNQGEPEPEISWTSTDPRVIAFGPGNPRADGIAHTLTGTGAGSRTINVRIMDRANNKSEICSATVGYTPPVGTITGNVYQNGWGECNNGQVLDGWTATCQELSWPQAIAAKIEGSKFTCCKDWVSGCNAQLTYDPTNGTSYNISLTPPADYKRTTCSGGTNGWTESGGKIITSVLLKGTTKSPKDLYLWKGASAWFQTKEGDVHAQGGTIISKIFPDNTYFSIFDTGNSPGLVSYNSTTLPNFGKLGLAGVSAKGWLAKDILSLSSGYDSFYSKLGSPDPDTLGSEELVDYINANPDKNVFYFDGSVTISKEWKADDLPSGRKVIVLINGNLEIDKEIKVPVGNFLAFIVKGDINIKGAIGDKKAVVGTPHLQGIYLADGSIDTYINKQDDINNGQKLGSGFRLVAAGIFYGKSGITLGRNLKNDCLTAEICNENTPAELFIARPDLFVNIPEELKTSYFFEQEIAP